MFVYRPAWWWEKHMTVVPFEERWTEIFEPTFLELRGIDGVNPDLILFQSGLWDARAFLELKKSKSNEQTLLPAPAEKVDQAAEAA